MDTFLEDLKKICLETEEVGKEVLSDLEGDMEDDLQYMCKSFSKRQLSQLNSLILLENNDDVILIARSMFEGALYLSYSIKYREMCRRWRLFSVVKDKERIDAGEQAPEEVLKVIEELLPEVDQLFKKENGEYQRSWYGNKSIRKIAKETADDFVYLYDKYYSPMSEYHHWATASFGKRYKLNLNDITETKTNEVKLERANAICMALSSIFSTLKVSCKLLKSEKEHKIKVLEKKLKSLDGTTTKEINITKKSS